MSAAELPKGVLVTDGAQRAALAVVRSLGQAGWRCIVGEDQPGSLAGCSRHASAEVVLPDPRQDPGRYADAVAEAVSRYRLDLVIPVAEPAVLALLAHRDRIPVRIPFPGLESFEAICDKDRVLAAAADLGICVPRQRVLGSAGDPLADVSFPVVLKPHRSVCTLPDGSRVKTGVRWAYSPEEAERELGRFPPSAFPVLAQEAVRGPGIGVFLLLHEGEVLAQYSHRRIREKPPSGGVSVLRQSEPLDPTLVERSIALLRRFSWTGVAMVEYKVNEDTGDAVLMEINGRFWGSLQLAVDSGIDFPRLLVEAGAEGGRGGDGYRFVRSRWFWGDVDHVLAVWRDPRSTMEAKVTALLGFLRAFGPGYREEIFRWTDPEPFVAETKSWIRHIVKR